MLPPAIPSPLSCADALVPSRACADHNIDARTSSFRRDEMKRAQGQVLLGRRRLGQVSHERPEPLQTAFLPLSASRLHSQLRTPVCRAQQVHGYRYSHHHRSSSLLFTPAVIGQLRVATDYAGSILTPRDRSSKSCSPQALPSPPLIYTAADWACCGSHLVWTVPPQNLARDWSHRHVSGGGTADQGGAHRIIIIINR